MGAHRDDREAARARIDALERDLADAREDAERARREADAARGETRAPRDERSEQTTPPDPRWRKGARPRYLRGMRALSCSVYALAASALIGAPLATEPLAMDRVAAIMLVGAGVLVVLTFVVGRAAPAPAPFEGALVTLLIAPIVLGILCAAASDDVWPTWLVGPVRVALRVVISLATVGVGVFATAAWSAEAASAPDRSED